jgi:hypothetical protein
MDFVKILKSFEEFVYEALTWLILLPRTLVRIVLRPNVMIDYASAQLQVEETRRFAAALSPPLLLILCVLLSHFVDLSIRSQTPVPGALASEILNSEQNLLLYRTIAFGLWPLVGACYLLWRTGNAVDRETLRIPFYEQCYLVAPFALLASVSVSLSASSSHAWQLVAVALLFVALLWYWLVQAAWMRRRAVIARWRASLAALVILLIGATVNGLVGVALVSSR